MRGVVILGCLEETSMEKRHMSREPNEVTVSRVVIWGKSVLVEETARARAVMWMHLVY